MSNEIQQPDLTYFGYAPGSYCNSCIQCHHAYLGDKRATRCLQCAKDAAKAHEQSKPDPAQFTHSLRCCRLEQDLKDADAYAAELEEAGGMAVRLVREMLSDCEIPWDDLHERLLELEDSWKQARMSKPLRGEIVPAAVDVEGGMP